MKIVKKLVAALMVLGALAALTVGVVFETGPERRRKMMLFGFAGIAAIAGLIFAAVVLVALALQP